MTRHAPVFASRNLIPISETFRGAKVSQLSIIYLRLGETDRVDLDLFSVSEYLRAKSADTSRPENRNRFGRRGSRSSGARAARLEHFYDLPFLRALAALSFVSRLI